MDKLEHHVRIEMDEIIEDPLWPGESKEPTQEEKLMLSKCTMVGDDLQKATQAAWELQEKVGKMGSIKLVRSLLFSGSLWCGSGHLSRKLAQHGHLSCIELMLQWDKLESPAASEMAAEYGQIKVLQLLQKYNQKHSLSTFSHAVCYGHMEVVQYLLDVGFRPSALDLTRAETNNPILYKILKPYEGQKTDRNLVHVPELRKMSFNDGILFPSIKNKDDSRRQPLKLLNVEISYERANHVQSASYDIRQRNNRMVSTQRPIKVPLGPLEVAPPEGVLGVCQQ